VFCRACLCGLASYSDQLYIARGDFMTRRPVLGLWTWYCAAADECFNRKRRKLIVPFRLAVVHLRLCLIAAAGGDYSQYAAAYGYAPIPGQYAGYSILTDAGWITSE
jgi:hypothetical protein